MKITSILAIVLCFAFIFSLALTGCKKNNDPYFMNSSEYDSLISGIAGGNSSQDTESDENSGEITNPPIPDKDGDEIDNSSTATPSKKPNSSSSKKPDSSSSKKPTSSKDTPTATSSNKPTSSKESTVTSSEKEESSSTKPSSSSKPQSSSSSSKPQSSSSSSKPAESSSSNPAASSSSKKPSGSISVGSKPSGAVDWIV